VPASLDRGLIFLGALGVYLATTAPGPWWLDSSELSAAGASLGVVHAPGHPLYVALAYAFSWLPVGSVAFRVAFLSTLGGALSLVLVHACAGRLCQAAGLDAERWPVRLSMATATLALGSGYALWHASVRAEVYTLHLVLALTALWLALGPLVPRRHLLGVAFLTGLGLANHHYLTVFWAPGVLVVLLVRAGAGRRELLQALPRAVGVGLLPLVLYALLPLGAARDPILDYGDPRTFGRFLDVVMAGRFQGAVTQVSQPLVERFEGVLDIELRGLGAMLALAAPFGLFVLWRGFRGLALGVLAAVVLSLGAKLVMRVDPGVPDHHAYLLPALALLAMLGAVALGRAISERRLVLRTLGLGSLGVAWVVGGVSAFEQWESVDLSGSRSAALVDAALMAEVRPDAVVMPYHYEHLFNRAYHQVLEGARPDVVMVHQGMDRDLDGGRALAARIGRRDPRLLPAFDALVASGGGFPEAEVLALAARRPVYLEPTLRPPLPAGRLAYQGGLFRVVPAGAPRPADAQAADAWWWTTTLVEEAGRDPEARKTVAGWWLTVAAVRLRQGLGQAALGALTAARTLAPGFSGPQRLRPLATELAEAERKADRAAHARLARRIGDTDLEALLMGDPP
jgi:hypothetical protein